MIYLKRHKNAPNVLQHFIHMNTTVPLPVENFMTDSAVLNKTLDFYDHNAKVLTFVMFGCKTGVLNLAVGAR